MSPRRLASHLLASICLLLAVGACDDSGDDGPGVGPTPSPSPTTPGIGDCGGTLPCGAARMCCDAGFECVANLACMPVCASQIRCGNDLTCCSAGEACVAGACQPADGCGGAERCGSVCCSAGQVCVQNACTTPSGDCTVDADCPAGEYCEPTLMACLPAEGGSCRFRPPAGVFSPVIDWAWEGWSEDDRVRHVLMTPVVGDIDADGHPEVAFNAYAAGDGNESMPIILDGATGAEELAGPAEALHTRRAAHMALANLDGDPQLEIVTGHFPKGIIALDLFEGALRALWVADRGSLDNEFNGVAPSIGDLDADGRPEIVVGRVVLSATGELLVDEGGAGVHPPDNFRSWGTVLADLSGDGRLDIVAGNAAWRYVPGQPARLERLWRVEGADDGYVAVADIDGDGGPEVVAVSSGVVRVINGRDGRVKFGPQPLPGGGRGGAPTVADFDLDGEAEFAVAGEGRYTVFDLECLGAGRPAGCEDAGVRWSRATDDASSSITGSSVFDFEGDGAAEVVYNDECYLWVYDGRTGAELLQEDNTSITAGEYPIIVDVDGDEKAELVVGANDASVNPRCRGATHGVRVLGDIKDYWVRTRAIWNQHSYHVTNIEDDGTVPAVEAPSWSARLGTQAYNAYRQNVPTEGDVLAAPDLRVSEVVVERDGCPVRLRVRATVVNDGSLGVSAGVSVTLYGEADGAAAVRLTTVATARRLLPGDSEVVVAETTIPSGLEGGFDLRVVVDDGGDGTGARAECHENNNAHVLPDQGCGP